MRKAGLALIATGLLLCAAAVPLFGIWLLHYSGEQRVASFPLVVGEPKAGDLWEVNPERRCRVTLGFRATTPSVWTGSGLIPEYKAKYKFPFSYRVTDADGQTVHAETTALMSDWGGPRSSHDTGSLGWRVFQEDVNSHGGTLTVEHRFQTFRAPSGRIRVDAAMDRDKWYKARAMDVELTLWDNSRGDTLAFIAILLVLLGLSSVFVGLLLATRAQGATRSPRPGPSGGTPAGGTASAH
jgi:hypothetical protein